MKSASTSSSGAGRAQHDMGVDIGSAYDDTSRRLGLAWHTYSAADNYGCPTIGTTEAVSC